MKENNMKKGENSPPLTRIHSGTFSAFHVGNDDEIVNFIFSEMPVGIIVLKQNMDIASINDVIFLNIMTPFKLLL